MTLNNRFIRSATYDASCTERGEVTNKTLEIHTNLAKSGVGLIITGLSIVHRSGQSFTNQIAIDEDSYIPALKNLTYIVHEHGAKIAIQLAHGGMYSRIFQEGKVIPLAPFYNETSHDHQYKMMNSADIEEIIRAFTIAAQRAKEAGFDAVQLHAAHSYLFSQFLSPVCNHRTDEWGGSLENRMRFHVEVVKSIRKAVGLEFPILIKLGIMDTAEDGLTLEEGCKVATVLADTGCNAIEISEGFENIRRNHMRKSIKLRTGEAYYSAWAGKVKTKINIPVILVGGLRSFDIIEHLIKANIADCVSMCRPFIREPGLVQRWLSGNMRPSTCISCNLCAENVKNGLPLECLQNKNPKSR